VQPTEAGEQKKPQGSLGDVYQLSDPSRYEVEGGIPSQAARQNPAGRMFGTAGGKLFGIAGAPQGPLSSGSQTPKSVKKGRESSFNEEDSQQAPCSTVLPKIVQGQPFVDIQNSETTSLRESIYSNKGTPSNMDKKSWLKFMVNPYSGSGYASARGPAALCQANLNQMNLIDSIPIYPRKADHWICHIGVGGFHRSHQANYLHMLREKKFFESKEGPNWGLCGIGLMEWDRKMYETLKKQDYMYTLISRGNSGSSATIVGSIMDYVYAPDDRSKPVERLADPSTHIVSLTITEKGYCQNVEGNLDTENFLIKHDLKEPDLPYSAIGLITQGLRVRKQRGMLPFTVLSCDNLPMNGNKTKKTILEYCRLVYPDMEEWVQEHVNFPNTMVDRITPITQAEHIEICKTDYGVVDDWPVIAEDFSQWVIEDKFSGARPFWEKLDGVLVVPDVHAYEWMKLRLLNGTHSALSYPSYLKGFRYVDDSLNDELIHSFVLAYMEEVKPTVPSVPGVDLDEYTESLAQRFSNSYIKDMVQRLAEDGSQKLQTTMQEAMLELVDSQKPIVFITTALACFIKYMSGLDMSGESIEGIKDPLAADLKDPCAKAIKSLGNEDATAKVLEMVFGEEVSECAQIVEHVTSALKAIVEDGLGPVLKALKDFDPASYPQ